MEFAEAVRRRRMVRNYTDEPVAPDALERVIAAAQRAPSAGHSQGQSLIVVTDEGTRAALARLAHENEYVAAGFDPWVSRAPVHIVVCTSAAVYVARYSESDKGGPEGPLADAENWPVPYWWVDAGATLMLLLLAAVDEGLAAGFLGSHAMGEIEELLGIPDDVTPIGLVTIGHAAPDRRSGSLDRGRRPGTVHRERWEG